MHINNSKRTSTSKPHPRRKPPSQNGRRGRPTVLTPCPFCRAEFGSREFRKHISVCGSRRFIDAREPVHIVVPESQEMIVKLGPFGDDFGPDGEDEIRGG